MMTINGCLCVIWFMEVMLRVGFVAEKMGGKMWPSRAAQLLSQNHPHPLAVSGANGFPAHP
jgi:hypothetical protein